MKLRIKGDSIRLRLSQAEVDSVGAGGEVAVQTGFPGGHALTYTLTPGNCQALQASFEDGVMRVSVPADQAARWATSQDVSLRGQLLLEGNRILAILIEKDFQCLVPREGEDEGGLYPHPEADNASC